jgi:hypothetical protein
VRKWDSHLISIYGWANTQAGIENVLNWLFKEIGEAMFSANGMGLRPLQELKDEVYLELADILAWTCAVAYNLRVESTSAVVEYYGRGCPHRECPQCVGCAIKCA